MNLQRRARWAPRARAISILTAALLLVVPATPAIAAPLPTPASLTSVTSPVLAATANADGAGRRAGWRRRRRAVRFARRQVGKLYRWGGSGPNAYDCSGLTRAAWARGGKSLPHSSRMQSRATRRVRHRKRRKGDLLFYGRPVHHVAIYIGNGKMIEAPRPGLRVRKVSAKRPGRVKIGRP
jgi:cell wall-associated NlpC family hydrolase